MKKILVTGFDPFGGADINPAWEAVKRLPDEINGCAITRLMVPTVYGKAARMTLDKAAEEKPDAIVMVGQAGGRPAVTPERVAVNIADARIQDNEGNQPENAPIDEKGPAAYFDTLGAWEIVRRMKGEGYRVSLSYSAGTFVCNDLFYEVSRAMAGEGTKVDFVHVPYLPEQGEPSMPMEETIRTLTRLLAIAGEDA